MSTKVTYSQITGTPSLSAVATSGSYTDLSSKPALFSGSYADLTNKPTLFSGSYADLNNKPIFSTVATSGSYADLLNKPALFSGSYADLTNKPSLAAVATSGSYNDLGDKPTFPFPSLVAQISSGPIPDGVYGKNLTFTMSGNVGTALQTVTGIPYYVWYTGQSSICTFLGTGMGPSPTTVPNIVMGGSTPGTPQNVTVNLQWQELDDYSRYCAWPYSFTLNIWA